VCSGVSDWSSGWCWSTWWLAWWRALLIEVKVDGVYCRKDESSKTLRTIETGTVIRRRRRSWRWERHCLSFGQQSRKVGAKEYVHLPVLGWSLSRSVLARYQDAIRSPKPCAAPSSRAIEAITNQLIGIVETWAEAQTILYLPQDHGNKMQSHCF
jgi:hypothetical protein